MDSETHGGEAAQVELAEGQEVAQAQQQAEVGGEAAGGSGYETLLAKRDERVAELEAQVAVAARSAEAAEALRPEIEAVKAAAADERVEYELRLAGARSARRRAPFSTSTRATWRRSRRRSPGSSRRHPRPPGRPACQTQGPRGARTRSWGAG